jgi:hypothetical protein
MPASLDELTRAVVVKVASAMILVLCGASWSAQRIVNQSRVSGAVMKNKLNPSLTLFLGCLTTISLMVLASAIATALILFFGKFMVNSNDKALMKVSSSINFCEMDFVDHPWIAEPANTASSLVSYIPLALLGLHGPPSKEWRLRPRHNRRFAVSYTTLMVIGIGSTLLHALLTGWAQGGDELPMLWFMASMSFTTLDVIWSGINNKAGPGSPCTSTITFGSENGTKLQLFVGISTLGATLLYLLCRHNFLPFYIMFITYSWITLIGLIMISFVLDWKDITFKTTVLLPFAICTALLAIMGITSWTSEMLFCNNIMAAYRPQLQSSQSWFTAGVAVQTLLPFFFNRGVHLCWHCSSALLAWLGIQTLIAAKGTQLGWGEAQINWWGAPYVSFYKSRNV